MRNYRAIAGHEHVYYQDTDSLHLTRYGFDRIMEADLLADNELGKFRLQQIAQHAFYLGQKQYRLDGQWTVAGVKSSAEWIGQQTFRQEVIAGLPSILASEPPQGVPYSRRIVRLRLGGCTGEKKSGGWVNPFWIDCI